jgi:valyl-tRNA synthetase
VVVCAGGYGAALRETLAATNLTSRVELEVLDGEAPMPSGEWAFGSVADTEIGVALPEVDATAERGRLEKELAEAAAHAERLEKQLANDTFRAKAPAPVIAGMETTLAETRDRVAGLRERLAKL